MKKTTLISDVKFTAVDGKIVNIEAPENMSGKRLARIKRVRALEISALCECSTDSVISSNMSHRDLESAILYSILSDAFEGDILQFYSAFYLAECDKLPSRKTVISKFLTYINTVL